MKLLIVDDQPGVTEGLCHGVNWAQLGFSQVQAVNSVREARAAMLNTVTDVMLCDIEMPEETGLELFKWVKKQGFATRCIFLTAHAKFSYAQEAMHLGAFDYIIQPAPYSEISQVTARAVKDVQASRDQNELTQMGRAFNEQAQAITAQAIRAFLSRQHNERDVKTLQGLGIFPRSDRDGYLVLIHILRWEPTADHWEKQLLAVALNNIAAETFAVHSELSPIASVDEHSYAMLLQNTAGEEMDLEGIMRQLMYISNVAQQYLRCSMAFYLDDKLPVPKMPDLWEKLLHMQDENVTLRSGVFRLKEAPRQPHIFRVPQIRTWNTLLKDGYPEAVEQEAMTLLDEMSARGEMNADSLRSFYQDFMQMIYFTVGGSEEKIHELFYQPEALELYRNGMKSVDEMKALIRYVTSSWTEHKSVDESKELLDKLKQYIDEHLESELRRDELAEYVHLNPDYLTRLMKKQTGYSLKEYVTRRKMETARTLLRTTTLPVGFIAAKLGYNNFSHFSYTYKKIMDVTPAGGTPHGGKMKLKLYHAAAAAAIALSVMLLTACGSPKQADPLPIIKLRTVGSSSEAACQRIGEALSELTAEKFGFTVEISQQSTTNYNAELERELLLGKEPDVFCYTDAENMFSLAADGTTEPLDDWLEEFPTLKEAVSQDRWNCMRYDGKLIAVPGNNPSAVAIGFEARTDVLDELGIDAASIQTMEDMHALLLAAKQQNPSSVPLVPHFGQTLMMLDCDPLNNGLGVLLHNTGTEVVNLYDTPEYEELCNQMHQWYTEGLILRDAPLTNAPNTRLMQMYGGVAFSHRVAEQNVVSVTRSTKQRLTSITLGSKLQNTSVLNIGWCISSRSEHKREGMQLLQYLYTDREAADLLLYGVEGVDYRRLDADHVTNIDELPANEWSTVHWGQPNCQAASTWVNADGTEVGYTGPTDVITSEAYGFTYTPKIELRPTVNSCLEIVRKYNNALLSGYLDPEEALPLFRSELHAAGIDKVIADKQYQLERWKAKNS